MNTEADARTRTADPFITSAEIFDAKSLQIAIRVARKTAWTRREPADAAARYVRLGRYRACPAV